MKTVDTIKEGLWCCSEEGCAGCPYESDCKETDNFTAIAKDALNSIQQLEAEKRDLLEERELNEYLRDKVKQLEAKVPKWISVKDKMPPTGNAVLVVVHNEKMAWTCVEVDVWDGRWLENADSDWHIVTHWMPLPEPPEV